ncbi:MAG: type II toxin-antitoxin system VapC family toxin [Gemmatimonadales bacterium]
MAAEVFVDTSAWFPLAVPADASHQALRDALRARVGTGARVVTTNLVVAETHAMLLRRVGRRTALSFVRTVRRPPNAVVTSTPELEEQAVTDWLDRYRDQDFSFTDAVSFAVMAERGISEALTLDRHFLAAGFVTLPAAR